MLTAEQTALVKTLEGIRDQAQTRAKRATQKYGTLSIGDWHAQGDVMFIRLEKVPERATRMENPSPKLAPGETRGSRHVVHPEAMPHLKFHALANPTALDGPVVEADAHWEVTHPDHGHVVVPPGIYQIRYQRQYARKLKRVQD